MRALSSTPESQRRQKVRSGAFTHVRHALYVPLGSGRTKLSGQLAPVRGPGVSRESALTGTTSCQLAPLGQSPSARDPNSAGVTYLQLVLPSGKDVSLDRRYRLALRLVYDLAIYKPPSPFTDDSSSLRSMFVIALLLGMD